MDRWTLRPLPALRGFCVEWAEPGELLISRRHHLYRTDAPASPRQPLLPFPAPRWRRLVARWRLAARVLRFAFYNVLKVSRGRLFVGFDRALGTVQDGRYRALDGLRRPCRVLRGAAAVDADGAVVFGEYVPNRGRIDDILVYRWPGHGDRVDVIHRFEPGAARHVHGIFRDPYEPSLWCLTGDREGECRILRTSDRFRTCDVVGGGDETWRAVSLQFRADAVYYAMDAEHRQNHLFRIDRATGRRERLADIDGPVYYSHRVGDDLFFGVTAELCPSQHGRSAALWHVSPADDATPIASFEKDAPSPRYFLPGAFYFPSGPGLEGRSFVHAVAFRHADATTFSLSREA
jgi:hypothetical protein